MLLIHFSTTEGVKGSRENLEKSFSHDLIAGIPGGERGTWYQIDGLIDGVPKIVP